MSGIFHHDLSLVGHGAHDHHSAAEIERRLFLNLAGMGAAMFYGVGLHHALRDTLFNTDALPPPAPQASATLSDLEQWNNFQTRFIAPEGRVVDTGNGGVSHSEGQGYGMLFAVWADDRATFERLWSWTQTNLQRAGDRLFSWRYRPHAIVKVDDPNDASDANIIIALALLRAGQRWDLPQYTAWAGWIARDILEADTTEIGDRLYLKPASAGFIQRGRVILNPSYYNFAALRALSGAFPDPRWHRLERDGRYLLEKARFGQWKVTPDWVEIDLATNQMQPAKGWPARFSWDAIRVPLNLVWAGDFSASALQSIAHFWTHSRQGEMRARMVDITSGLATTLPAQSGMTAIAALALEAVTFYDQGLDTYEVKQAASYYDASLMLLARIAEQESGLYQLMANGEYESLQHVMP